MASPLPGCDINMKDTNQHSPMYMACEHGNEDVLACLLLHTSIKLNEDDNSVVPLHIAALKGHAAIIEMLVRAGCRINQVRQSYWQYDYSSKINFSFAVKFVISANATSP